MNDISPQLGKLLERPVEIACKLFESLLGKPFEVIGEIATDQLQAWQWANRVRVAEKAEILITEKKIVKRVLPPSFLVPLIRSCGDADDETLQQAWARLLVDAVADDDSQHIAFVRTLEQLSPIDVRVLDYMIHNQAMPRGEDRTNAIANGCALSVDQVSLTMANIQHLGFFTPTSNRLRSFALRFLAICIGDLEAVEEYSNSQKQIPSKPLID